MSENDNNNSVEIIQPSAQDVLNVGQDTWMIATKSFQNNLIRSLQEYRTSIIDDIHIGIKRREMITQVTAEYTAYLREQAKLTSQIALKTQKAVLERQLREIQGEMFEQMAEIVGSSVANISKIMNKKKNEIDSPILQEAYAQYVMTKVFELMEMEIQKDKDKR
jgi:transcriptional regulator with XRE-family HTH domain